MPTKTNNLSKLKSIFSKTIDKVRSLRNKPEVPAVRKTSKKATGMSIVKDGNVMFVHVAPSSVAKGTTMVLLVLALAYFLLQIGNILLLFFVAFLFTAGLDNTVTRFKTKYHIPRSVSVIILYILILLFLAITITTLAPLVADQISALSSKIFQFFNDVAAGNSKLPFSDDLAPYFQRFTESVNLEQLSVQITDYIQNFSSTILSFGGNVWDFFIAVSNGLLNTVLVLVLTFFMVVEWAEIERFFVSLFPTKHTEYVVSHIDAVKTRIGFWLRGQIMLSLAMGLLTYIGLLAIGLDYAVTLALIAAISEFIPVVGPIIALLVTIPVAANVSFSMLIWTLILFFGIQQIEGNILVPVIMKKAVGLSPIVVMLAMLVGYQYLGILGIILSIPVAACTSIFVKDYTTRVKAK